MFLVFKCFIFIAQMLIRYCFVLYFLELLRIWSIPFVSDIIDAADMINNDLKISFTDRFIFRFNLSFYSFLASINV